jgi:hypothetical protein
MLNNLISIYENISICSGIGESMFYEIFFLKIDFDHFKVETQFEK